MECLVSLFSLAIQIHRVRQFNSNDLWIVSRTDKRKTRM